MSIKSKGKVTRSKESKPAYQQLFEPAFEITAWCRDEKAELPPEQVHFIIHWPVNFQDLPPLAIRFKGPDNLGFFIEELTKYRREVWPDCEVINGELIEAILSQETIETGKLIDEAFDDLTERIKALQNKPPEA